MKNSSVKQLLESDELVIGISELSKMTGVSPRQLRYWEERSYIESIATETKGSRQYRLPTVLKVEMIKSLLDEGYTLTAAVERAKEKQRSIHEAKLLLKQTMKEILMIGDRYIVLHLADFSNNEQAYLVKELFTEKVLIKVGDKDIDLNEPVLEMWFDQNTKG
ncbi:transcriptional regulator [Enterococcus florum]|uniref:Transcriptional regulator n=1 Tax=Enterococcus florum TaxID=2480627 RepID=A0A4P5P3R3_9ENTE|nr:MerR family transcriptional regulator [Enterococcus florum]GCF92377.1 transcriptional regulator [Enterococcus florum]